MKTKISILYAILTCGMLLGFDAKDFATEKIKLYPEMFWLADEHVHHTEDGVPAKNASLSEQFFGKKYIEFDRSIMTLYCLEWIIDGSDASYHAFTHAQPEEIRLRRESFDRLHERAQLLLNSQWGGLSQDEMKKTMEAALVLGDIGKTERAHEVFAINHPDHDDFYGEVMGMISNSPELLPTFAQLKPAGQELLKKTANLAHFGHITHLEGWPKMFRRLKECKIAQEDPLALDFELLIHTCDVAGAFAHINPHSSLVYHENTHRSMEGIRDAIRLFEDPNMTEKDAYESFLSLRAKWLGLDPENYRDRVLTRVGAMLRLFNEEEGRELREAMESIDFVMKLRIIQTLEPFVGFEPTRTPTYMPAFLVNIASKDGLAAAVKRGLPIIARALETHRKMISEKKIDPDFPLNFNPMAGAAKTAANISRVKIFIDQEGYVRPKDTDSAAPQRES